MSNFESHFKKNNVQIRLWVCSRSSPSVSPAPILQSTLPFSRAARRHFSLTISSCWRCHASASPCKVWDCRNPALNERPSRPSPWIMQSYRLCQSSAGRRGGSQLDIQLLKLTGCPHFETNCWQTALTPADKTWMCSYEMNADVSVWRQPCTEEACSSVRGRRVSLHKSVYFRRYMPLSWRHSALLCAHIPQPACRDLQWESPAPSTRPVQSQCHRSMGVLIRCLTV